MTDGPKPDADAQATNLPPSVSSGGNNHGSTSKRGLAKPWVKGQSGNPNGRPKIEPRVRRYARKYDRQMCRVLASIAEDEKAPWSERRRAAMDLIAVGSGRPPTTQELVGRPDAPLGPLVSISMGNPGTTALSPAQARAILRRPRDATPAQVEAAEIVIYSEAERAAAALPSPSPQPALEAIDPGAEVPDNVIRLPDQRSEKDSAT